jgi:hypothetical protein
MAGKIFIRSVKKVSMSAGMQELETLFTSPVKKERSAS